MADSAIPAVEAALLGQLEGQTDGAPLVEGKPEPSPAEFVALWEVNSTTDFDSLGQQKLIEEIELMVVIESILMTGEEFAPSKERAQEIAAAVETGFREDLTLSGAWRFGRISGRKQQYFRTDNHRGCRIFLTFAGRAQT